MTSDDRHNPARATRLTILCRGASEANRQALFGGDGPLLAREAERLGALATRLGRFDRLSHAPEQASRETAAAFLPMPVSCPELADIDYGCWIGKSLTDIAEIDPEGLRQWMADPLAAPHGGESLEAARARVASWLEGLHGQGGHSLAVTHAILLKLLLAYILCASTSAIWQIDAAPLATLSLSSDGRRWALRGFAETP